MRPVNLLPPEERPGRPGLPTGLPAAALAGVLAGALVIAVAGVAVNLMTGAARADREDAEAHATRLEAQVAATEPADDRLAGLVARRDTALGLARSRVAWDRLLGSLASGAPAEVWLTRLVGDPPDPAAADPAAAGLTGQAPAGIHLEGFAPDRGRVAELVAHVDGVRGLSGAAPSVTAVEPRGGRDVVRFSMDASLTLGAVGTDPAAGTAPAGGMP